MSTMTKSALDKIAGNAASSSVYEALMTRLKTVGRFEVEPKAGSLHIVRGRAFLGVHYRKDGILLNIVLDHPLKGARIRAAEQVSRSRYHNEVLLSTVRDVDRELMDWVKEAYELTA
jgi:hypothetical protein